MRDDAKPNKLMPISFVNVMPDKIDDPVVCRTWEMTDDPSIQSDDLHLAKAIMKWLVNSTEIPMLIIKFTSDSAFNSMSDVCMHDMRCKMKEIRVIVKMT